MRRETVRDAHRSIVWTTTQLPHDGETSLGQQPWNVAHVGPVVLTRRLIELIIRHERVADAPRVRSACPGCLDERLLHGHSRSLLPAASARRAIASACASVAWKTPPRAQAPGGVDDRVRDALGDRDAARRRARPRRPRYRRRPRPSARWQGGRSADPWR